MTKCNQRQQFSTSLDTKNKSTMSTLTTSNPTIENDANKNSRRFKLLVLMGPSGAGKTTLLRKLMDEFPNRLGYSVSHTTRPPRPGEVCGVHYHFVPSVAEFDRLAALPAPSSAPSSSPSDTIVNGGCAHQDRADDGGGGLPFFLETACVHGNKYGTSSTAVQAVLATGKCVVLDLDIQGARSLRRILRPSSPPLPNPPPHGVTNSTGASTHATEIILSSTSTASSSSINNSTSSPLPRFVVVRPPSLTVVETRLRARGDGVPEAVIQMRLANAAKELAVFDAWAHNTQQRSGTTQHKTCCESNMNRRTSDDQDDTVAAETPFPLDATLINDDFDVCYRELVEDCSVHLASFSDV